MSTRPCISNQPYVSYTVCTYVLYGSKIAVLIHGEDLGSEENVRVEKWSNCKTGSYVKRSKYKTVRRVVYQVGSNTKVFHLGITTVFNFNLFKSLTIYQIGLV